MTQHNIEHHPLSPFLPNNARLLMLGSFPPPQIRWTMPFYYPNYQNDMWRIFGLVFFNDKNYFVDAFNKCFYQEKIEHFLCQQGIAIFDTAIQIQRLKNNAADQFLKVIQATDVVALLTKIPECRYILTTGDKATDTLLLNLPDNAVKPTLQQKGKVHVVARDIELYRLPSSSRAYPLALEKKAQSYQNFFKETGFLKK